MHPPERKQNLEGFVTTCLSVYSPSVTGPAF
jgi:hypothetical protein